MLLHPTQLYQGFSKPARTIEGTIKTTRVQIDSNEGGGNLEGEKNLSLPHWEHRKNDLEHNPEPF